MVEIRGVLCGIDGSRGCSSLLNGCIAACRPSEAATHGTAVLRPLPRLSHARARMASAVTAAYGVAACTRRQVSLETYVRAPSEPASTPAKEPAIVGVLCGAGAALCWAAGFVAVRRGLDAGLTPADIAVHRFAWVGLALLPFMLRRGVSPGGLRDLGGVGWVHGLIVFVLAGPIQAV